MSLKGDKVVSYTIWNSQSRRSQASAVLLAAQQCVHRYKNSCLVLVTSLLLAATSDIQCWQVIRSDRQHCVTVVHSHSRTVAERAVRRKAQHQQQWNTNRTKWIAVLCVLCSVTTWLEEVIYPSQMYLNTKWCDVLVKELSEVYAWVWRWCNAGWMVQQTKQKKEAEGDAAGQERERETAREVVPRAFWKPHPGASFPDGQVEQTTLPALPTVPANSQQLQNNKQSKANRQTVSLSPTPFSHHQVSGIWDFYEMHLLIKADFFSVEAHRSQCMQ